MSECSLFTSESVSESHPDRIADQISGAVLDAIMARDKKARAPCETMVKTGEAIVAGENKTKAWVDLECLVRNVILDMGYSSSSVGFDGETCGVLNLIGKQSDNISQGVAREIPKEQGAGDQGMMLGYATNETESYMPVPIHYSPRLVERQAELCKSGLLPWLRPDAKSQHTYRYGIDGHPQSVEAVVFFTQHDPGISPDKLRKIVKRDQCYALSDAQENEQRESFTAFTWERTDKAESLKNFYKPPVTVL